MKQVAIIPVCNLADSYRVERAILLRSLPLGGLRISFVAMLLRARVRLRHPEARAMRWRLRSVRTSILLLVLVPVLSLIGIYVFAIGSTASNAVNLSRANSVKNALGDPMAAFMAQLSTERLLAVVYMSAPSGANLAKLNLQETKTNAATAGLRSTLTSGSTVSDASPAEKQAIAGLLRGIASLPSLRSQVSAQIIPSSRAFNDYNAIVQQSNRVLSAAIRQQNSAQLVAQALAFVRMGQSEDMLAQENTLLVAGQTSRQFTPADLQAFTQLVGSRRAFYNLTLPDLDPQYRAYYTRAIGPREYLALLSMENTVVGTRPGGVPSVSPLAWQQAAWAWSRSGSPSPWACGSGAAWSASCPPSGRPRWNSRTSACPTW